MPRVTENGTGCRARTGASARAVPSAAAPEKPCRHPVLHVRTQTEVKRHPSMAHSEKRQGSDLGPLALDSRRSPPWGAAVQALTTDVSNRILPSPPQGPAGGPGPISEDRYEKALLSEGSPEQEIQQLA